MGSGSSGGRRAGAAVVGVVLAVALAAACGSGGSGGDGSGDGGARGGRPSEGRCDGTIEAPAPQFIVDDCGRVVILRGTNVQGGNKGRSVDDRHLPETFDEQRHLGKFGWNGVRFLISWGAVEPEQGAYDETYLDELEEWMDYYAEHDIHVVLDMHQDVYGWAVGGNGAPDWAVITDGLEPAPLPEGTPWWLATVDPAAQAAYQNFWDLERGHPELREHFLAAWGHVAERFADHPAVIGYDLLNEPVFANGDLDATLAIQADAAAGKFHNSNLTEFTQQGIDTLRAADDDAWIMVEPTSLLNAFPYPGDLIFDQLTDPRDGPPRLGYAPHYYEMSVHEGTGFPADSPYVEQWSEYRTAEADAMRATLYMGEFGGPPDQHRMDEYFAETLAMADRTMMGWAQWSWDPVDDPEGAWSPVTKAGELTRNGERLARVQPRAVAGVPESFSWDPATSVFHMTWSEREGVVAPTELAVPVGVWDGRVEVVLDGEVVDHDIDDARGVLSFRPASDGPTHDVCVRWGADAGACS